MFLSIFILNFFFQDFYLVFAIFKYPKKHKFIIFLCFLHVFKILYYSFYRIKILIKKNKISLKKEFKKKVYNTI